MFRDCEIVSLETLGAMLAVCWAAGTLGFVCNTWGAAGSVLSGGALIVAAFTACPEALFPFELQHSAQHAIQSSQCAAVPRSRERPNVLNTGHTACTGLAPAGAVRPLTSWDPGRKKHGRLGSCKRL